MLSHPPTKQTEPQQRPSRLPQLPQNAHKEGSKRQSESQNNHHVCLSRGRRTQDLQQSEMQIHCRMHVAGRCPCNARHARHAAGLHTSMLPRPGLQAFKPGPFARVFLARGRVSLWYSLWPLHVLPPRPCSVSTRRAGRGTTQARTELATQAHRLPEARQSSGEETGGHVSRTGAGRAPRKYPKST